MIRRDATERSEPTKEAGTESFGEPRHTTNQEYYQLGRHGERSTAIDAGRQEAPEPIRSTKSTAGQRTGRWEPSRGRDLLVWIGLVVALAAFGLFAFAAFSLFAEAQPGIGGAR